CHLYRASSERPDHIAASKDVASGKAFCLLGWTAGCCSHCVSDLSSAGRHTKVVVSLQSRLLHCLGFGAASGNVSSSCGKVVRSSHFPSSRAAQDILTIASVKTYHTAMNIVRTVLHAACKEVAGYQQW